MVTQLKYKNILLCTDYSKDAEVAFVHAYDQAIKYKAKLHILNVISLVNPCKVQIFEKPLSKAENKIASDKIDEHNRIEELGALKRVYHQRCEDLNDHEFVVRTGSPDIEIIRYAEENDIDMIILGTAGLHDNKRRANVRTSENVSRYANCQVITIGSPKQ